MQTNMLRPGTQFLEQYEQSGEENHSSEENDETNDAKLPLEVQLIKHIAREQAFYNPKHEFYRNSVRKDEKWLKIGASIGWSESQCKAKWKAFRDQYCRELKRSKKNPKATVKWKYFKYLEFLRPFALSRNYRPRYVPATTTKTTQAGNSMSTTAGLANNNNNNYKTHGVNSSSTNVDTAAALIASDFALLQSIKLEPQAQQDEQQQLQQQQQQEFLDNCTTTLTSTTLNNATTQHNIKNETIVVIAAEQFQQHLNNVYQQQHPTNNAQHQQLTQSQQQHLQQQHIESWSFLASTTTTAPDGLLNQQQTTQQQISNDNHNGSNNDNNNFSYIHNASNSSSNADADTCLYNAFANCVAAAEADVAAAAAAAAAAANNTSSTHHSTHESTPIKGEQQLQQKSLPLFLPPQPLLQSANNIMTTNTPTATNTTLNTTSSDDEDDDSIHTFLNIESFFEKELIANVQSEGILYNTFHPNYRNVKLKLDVWSDIARKMKKTVKQCRLKWKALRDQYIREHKRLRNREDNEMMPRWKHYNALNFLHKFIKHKSETEEKQIFLLPKAEIELNEELLISGDGSPASIMHHATVQQKLQLQATLIELNDGHVERRLTATDIISEATNQTSTTAATSGCGNATSLLDITENHDHDAQDDYDAMDIDEYIITEVGGGNNNDDGDDNTHQQLQQNKSDKDSVDANNVNGGIDNNVDLVNYVDGDDNVDDCMLTEENQKAINQLHQSYTNDECILQNESEIEAGNQQQAESLNEEAFENLKHIVDLPMQDGEQQHQTSTATTTLATTQDESIMQVVGLGNVDDELVINNASVAQLGFVVTKTTTTTTTPARNDMEQPQQQQLQLHHQQQQPQHTNFVSITKTSPSVQNSLQFYSNHNKNQELNTNFLLNNASNNNSNNNHNNSNNIVSNAHDVGSVLSAIASCADFNTNFNRTISTSATATSSSLSLSSSSLSSVSTHNNNLTNILPNIVHTTTQPQQIATSTTTSSSVPNTISSTSVTNLTSNISNALNSGVTTTTSYVATNPITVSSLNSSAVDDDEVGTFFHSITMKVRSLNLSPIEFTDLQIEVLRVINRSIRKN